MGTSTFSNTAIGGNHKVRLETIEGLLPKS